MKTLYAEIRVPERQTVKTCSSNEMIHINVFKLVNGESKQVGVVQIWPGYGSSTLISLAGMSDEKTAHIVGEFDDSGKLHKI